MVETEMRVQICKFVLHRAKVSDKLVQNHNEKTLSMLGSLSPCAFSDHTCFFVWRIKDINLIRKLFYC